MGDFGIKASQQGADARTAADYEQSLHSSWPYLKIAQQGSFGAAGITIPHGFSYVPIALVFDNLYYRPVERFTVSRDSSAAVITDTSLVIPAQTNGYKGKYYIFDWEMGKNYTAPVKNIGVTGSPKESDVGVKVALPRKSVNSRDLRDFSLHTNTRSFSIYKSGSAMAANVGDLVEIDHFLGYEPFAFVWYKHNGAWSLHPLSGGANVIGGITTTKLSFGATFTSEFRYIIFKDPFLLDF